MFENIKDPHHASLLHVFLVSFGLFRADQPSKVQMDATGRHGALIPGEEIRRRPRQLRHEIADRQLQLRIRRFEPVREFRAHRGDDDPLAQPHHPAAVEHSGDASAYHRGPAAFGLTFGYAGDDEAMIRRRCAGEPWDWRVSIDDSEVMNSLGRRRSYPEGRGWRWGARLKDERTWSASPDPPLRYYRQDGNLRLASCINLKSNVRSFCGYDAAERHLT
jgi:hypothetical protein